ncbi:MAG: biosynthetic-type acetolactate synthase large subunit, partial [Acidimicrobiales bacterium]|nr:biosynthetic-type acetolactate synthase large subunit [Acidimicrobiales bacterium]
MMQINGAQAVLKALEHEGVETVFGMPGGAILPVYDPLIESSIRHILVRHEQGAGHMASGYAHATGKPGVAIVTSGPAATNMVTALLDAMMDSIPMVCITGQVALPAIGTDAFQEADTTGITMSATKHNYLVTKVEDIPQVIHDAFHLATTGRPGPVLVDIPKDLVLPDAVFEWYEPTGHDLPGYNPKTEGDPASIAEASKMIMAAKRPVIYSGGGILRSRAADELRTLAEMTGIPVVTTLMNRGGFPDDHELNLGMPGMHGNYTAVMAMQEADLLIALGARFDDRVTGARDKFAPDAKIIHVDIDPAELGKVRFAHVPIAGDAKSIITEMIKEIETLGGADAQPDRDAWRQTLSGWQEKYPLVYGDHEPGKLLKPQFVIEKLAEACPPDTILCSGVGQHQMWA